MEFREFMRYLIDEQELTEMGSKITKALLDAQSPLTTDIAENMTGLGLARWGKRPRSGGLAG